VGHTGKGEYRPSSVVLLKLSHSAEKFSMFCRKGIKGKQEEGNSQNMMLLPKHSPWKYSGLFYSPRGWASQKM